MDRKTLEIAIRNNGKKSMQDKYDEIRGDIKQADYMITGHYPSDETISRQVDEFLSSKPYEDKPITAYSVSCLQLWDIVRELGIG